MSEVDKTKVPRAHIKGICESFGFDPAKVLTITMTPAEVTIECRERMTFTTHRIPVVP